jgi:hypothetical protein
MHCREAGWAATSILCRDMNVVCVQHTYIHTCRHVLNTHTQREMRGERPVGVLLQLLTHSPHAERQGACHEACDSVKVLTAISTSIKISWIRLMHTYWCIKSRVKWVGPRNMQQSATGRPVALECTLWQGSHTERIIEIIALIYLPQEKSCYVRCERCLVARGGSQ